MLLDTYSVVSENSLGSQLAPWEIEGGIFDRTCKHLALSRDQQKPISIAGLIKKSRLELRRQTRSLRRENFETRSRG